MKSITSTNAPSVKYLVLYIIRIGPMYSSESVKDVSDATGSTLKKTKNETTDLRRPYIVACETTVELCHPCQRVRCSDQHIPAARLPQPHESVIVGEGDHRSVRFQCVRAQ